jgi:rod shape-determining protein MreC
VRNLILFIRRHANLLLFFLLEGICLILISRTQTLQGNSLLSSANAVSGALYQKREDVLYYFSLKKINDSLLQENARLRQLFALATHSVDTFSDEVKDFPLTSTTVDSRQIIQYAKYTYRSARVINNSVTAENNYITINRGAKSGIRKNMAVLSASGAVGRVIQVSDNFATVLSILNVKQEISAKLSDGNIGSVGWEEGNPDILLLKNIPQQIEVKIGDSVYTSSYSFFPPGVLIGTVTKKFLIRKNNLQLLYLKPATNFRNLNYVYVVENSMLEERRILEDSTQRKK